MEFYEHHIGRKTTLELRDDEILPFLRRAFRLRFDIAYADLDDYFIPYPLRVAVVDSDVLDIMFDERLAVHTFADVVNQVFVDQLQYSGLAAVLAPHLLHQQFPTQGNKKWIFLGDTNTVFKYCYQPLEDLRSVFAPCTNSSSDVLRDEFVKAGLRANGYTTELVMTPRAKVEPLPDVDHIIASVVLPYEDIYFLWEYDAAADCGVALVVYAIDFRRSKLQWTERGILSQQAFCMAVNPERAADVSCPLLRNVLVLLNRTGNGTNVAEVARVAVERAMEILRQRKCPRYAAQIKPVANKTILDVLSAAAP